MSKKQYNDIDKKCPICGGLIWGKAQKVLIEGAKITVCQNCAQHGIKIQGKPQTSYPKSKKITKPKTSQEKSYPRKDDLEDIEIMLDYATRIRNARNSYKLNQDQFAQKLNEKPSLLRRIEAGKVEPTIKLAKKIEKAYNIKLIKKVDETEPSAQSSKYMKKTKGSSLGDIAFIKKKK